MREREKQRPKTGLVLRKREVVLHLWPDNIFFFLWSDWSPAIKSEKKKFSVILFHIFLFFFWCLCGDAYALSLRYRSLPFQAHPLSNLDCCFTFKSFTGFSQENDTENLGSWASSCCISWWEKFWVFIFIFLFKMFLCLADLCWLVIKLWSSASIGLRFLGVYDSLTG